MENKVSGFKFFGSVVKEFIRALGKRHTYNIRKNSYLIFGILWGIPVPLVTIGISLYYRNLEPSLNNMIAAIIADPIHIFFLIHPILFGIVFGAMGTVRDDKERQRQEFEKNLIEMNKKLEITNKKLKELDELKDNFLSMVSHELWSPLTTVQGYVTFVKDGKGGPITAKQKELLEIADDEIDSLSHLIGELVDISRIEAGKFEVKLGCVDIVNVQVRVIDSLKQAAEKKNISLKNEIPPRLPYVLADKKRITQVLTNLLGNAIKFTPEGRAVSISARENGEAVEFSITDNGIGIPENSMEKIFDKFYQVDSTNERQYNGCGLGLAITKNIIELHRGRIWVESKVGEGSKFFFELQKCSPQQCNAAA